MTRAIYIRREDGDFDFVAAFSKDHLPDAPSDWPQEIAEWLESQREEVLIVNNCDLQYLPDVWDGTARNLRQIRVKPLKHEKMARRFLATKTPNNRICDTGSKE